MSNKTKFKIIDKNDFIIDFPTIQVYIDIEGFFGIVINKNKQLFYNICFFNDVLNEYYINLFRIPKQKDKQSQINIEVIKYLYKRIFGI